MKTLLSTLFLGAGLVLVGCWDNKKNLNKPTDYSPITIKGKVLDEFCGEKIYGQKYRAYLVSGSKTNNQEKYIAVINDPAIDPFNIGDSVSVKLGNLELVFPDAYNNGKLIPEKRGYKIIEYKILK